jgi:hypothetical protein
MPVGRPTKLSKLSFDQRSEKIIELRKLENKLSSQLISIREDICCLELGIEARNMRYTLRNVAPGADPIRSQGHQK